MFRLKTKIDQLAKITNSTCYQCLTGFNQPTNTKSMIGVTIMAKKLLERPLAISDALSRIMAFT